jgi:hypothetical protein
MDRNWDSCRPIHRLPWRIGCTPRHGNSGATGPAEGQEGNPSGKALQLPMLLRALCARNNRPCSFPMCVQPRHTSKSSGYLEFASSRQFQNNQIYIESKTSEVGYLVTGVTIQCDNSRFLDNISPYTLLVHCRRTRHSSVPDP